MKVLLSYEPVCPVSVLPLNTELCYDAQEKMKEKWWCSLLKEEMKVSFSNDKRAINLIPSDISFKSRLFSQKNHIFIILT